MSVNKNIYYFSEVIHNNPDLTVEFFTCPITSTRCCDLIDAGVEFYGYNENSFFDAFRDAYEQWLEVYGQ